MEGLPGPALVVLGGKLRLGNVGANTSGFTSNDLTSTEVAAAPRCGRPSRPLGSQGPSAPALAHHNLHLALQQAARFGLAYPQGRRTMPGVMQSASRRRQAGPKQQRVGLLVALLVALPSLGAGAGPTRTAGSALGTDSRSPPTRS